MYSLNDIEDLVNGLNTTLYDLDRNYKVFDGKCCFISYCIAKQLEKSGIQFDVVGYSHVKLTETSIMELGEAGSLAHVSILIKAGNERFIIGDKLIDSKNLTIYAQKMTSDELLDMYKTCDWNDGAGSISDTNIEQQIDEVFMYTL